MLVDTGMRRAYTAVSETIFFVLYYDSASYKADFLWLLYGNR